MPTSFSHYFCLPSVKLHSSNRIQQFLQKYSINSDFLLEVYVRNDVCYLYVYLCLHVHVYTYIWPAFTMQIHLMND